MQACQLEPRTPTPLLDDLRPRLLRALQIRGWTCEPSQHGATFRVRARRKFGEDARTGNPRTVLAHLSFDERGGGVTYATSGHGAVDAVRDLRAEGVLQ